MFSYLDKEHRGTILLQDWYAFALPKLGGERVTEARLQQHFEHLAQSGVNPSSAFRQFDAQESGFVTLHNFKAGLASLGISLVDEPAFAVEGGGGGQHRHHQAPPPSSSSRMTKTETELFPEGGGGGEWVLPQAGNNRPPGDPYPP